MAARNHLLHQPVRSADAREILIRVLSARIDRTYMTLGSASGRRFVRDVLERINAGALTTAVYELGLGKEVTREATRLEEE